MITLRILLAGLLVTGLAAAQQVKWNYDKLAAKASDTVDVNLEGSLLRLALKFVSSSDDDVKVKKALEGLKGIYVKSFEFKNAGEYSPADVEGFRAKLRGWQRIVGTHSTEDGEDVEVYVMNDGNAIDGLAIIATEPKELTLVNIVGPIDLDTLSELGDHFPGIPKVEVDKGEKKK
jgi:Domain of unknown function (DUF4252)